MQWLPRFIFWMERNKKYYNCASVVQSCLFTRTST
jgi:hypothetical protein